MTKIEKALEQVNAMDSDTLQDLLESLEAVHAFMNGNPDAIMNKKEFPDIVEALGYKTADVTKLVEVIGRRIGLKANDFGELILVKRFIILPFIGRIILNLEDDGRFTITQG